MYGECSIDAEAMLAALHGIICPRRCTRHRCEISYNFRHRIHWTECSILQGLSASKSLVQDCFAASSAGMHLLKPRWVVIRKCQLPSFPSMSPTTILVCLCTLCCAMTAPYAASFAYADFYYFCTPCLTLTWSHHPQLSQILQILCAMVAS